MDYLKDWITHKERELAEEIIQLDLKRDALFEELIAKVGSRAHELLRKVQNGF